MKPREILKTLPTWLLPVLTGLLVLGVLLYQQRGLDQLAEAVQLNSNTRQVQSLDARISVLEQFKASALTRPPTVILKQFSEHEQALEERLTALEAQLADRALSSDLRGVRETLTALTVSIQKFEAEKSNGRVVERRTLQPTQKRPPFTLRGIEVRGGHSLVALSPLDKPELEHILWLRLGDQYLDWQLDAIEPSAVVFQIDGQRRRLEVRSP
ncbi:hypothetical protein [Pseudomonas fluorescens]|uniref:hypothetical protein n=1 Tax=Pseudomonas fluorescens TaxID=294 RepID=UPI001BE6770E|nr:hypothetical protein [Pseudomonas fluorescens]MBT2375319.1 hypothetical protein [Pseudomonas fluorescens]